MIQKKLRKLIFWLGAITVLGLTGCATSPDLNNDAERFATAKEAFVQHEYVKAIYLLEPLAIKGHSSAQYTLGYLYYYGLGVTQNVPLATKWITSAATKGHKKAIAALGLLRKQASAPKRESSQKTEEQANNHEKPSASLTTQNPIVTQIVEIEQPAIAPLVAATFEEPDAKSQPPIESDEQSWIAQQPPGNYTIQLASLASEEAAKKFMQNLTLEEPLNFYSYSNQGSARFGIIYGSFHAYKEAYNALENLPKEIASSSPWVRNFITIQSLLQRP